MVGSFVGRAWGQLQATVEVGRARLAGAPEWCKMVHMDARGRPKAQRGGTTRASVSFPSEVYEELARLAAAKKVSVAWVVREAAEHYVAEQWPLFARSQEQQTS